LSDHDCHRDRYRGGLDCEPAQAEGVVDGRQIVGRGQVEDEVRERPGEECRSSDQNDMTCEPDRGARE
jgi:hypothetical protein